MTAPRLTRMIAAAALLGSLAACGGDDEGGGAAGGGSAAVATDKVDVVDFQFKPGDITVKAGTTVTWTFKDDADHTVGSKTGESEIKESPLLKDGATHTHTFATAGTFEYVCTIHNSMTGSVVVTA